MKPELNQTQAIYLPEGPKPKVCVTTTIVSLCIYIYSYVTCMYSYVLMRCFSIGFSIFLPLLGGKHLVHDYYPSPKGGRLIGVEVYMKDFKTFVVT